MKLRERQIIFRDRCVAAIAEFGDTLGVAPTGAGKTVMGSAIAGAVGKNDQIMFLQHRDELLAQNRRTFEAINPAISTCIYNAERKELDYQAIFGSIDTIKRESTLAKMPPVGVLVIDEAHHAAADGWQRTIHALRMKNPSMKLFGMTATANRGDKKALRGIFTNCADQITLAELINTGFLVRPRTLVVDIGVTDALRGVRKLAADFDMSAVAAIMDNKALNDDILKHWREQAGNRQTVIFCSTVEHANHVAATFSTGGINAAVVWGDMGSGDRRAVLDAYDKGTIQVLCNVAVLTEGWDHQPTSCIVLLRPSSYKSTMIQMIGRGLRKVDPERYPGVHKDDCVVIDFGTSVLTHGKLEEEHDLDQKGIKGCPECQAKCPSQCKECPICGYVFPPTGGEAPMKECEACETLNYTAVKVCVHCGTQFPPKEIGELKNFILSEVDLLQDSPFQWEKLFDGIVMMASAIDAWAACISYNGRWLAIGGGKDRQMSVLADNSDRLLSLVSADDFLRENGDTTTGNKAKRWLHEPATDSQMRYLRTDRMTAGFGLTKYRACCLLDWQFNEKGIRDKCEKTQLQRIAA